MYSMVVYAYVHKHVRTTWYSTSQYLPVKSSQIVKVFSYQIAPCSHCPGAKDSISSQISRESQSPCGHRKQPFETDMNFGELQDTSSHNLFLMPISRLIFSSSNSQIPQRFDERVAWRSTPSSLLTFLCHATRHWGSFLELRVWDLNKIRVSTRINGFRYICKRKGKEKHTSTSWVAFMYKPFYLKALETANKQNINKKSSHWKPFNPPGKSRWHGTLWGLISATLLKQP